MPVRCWKIWIVVSRSDSPGATEPGNWSGGGIAFGGGTRARSRPGAGSPDLIAGLRRRWASGIAVITAVDAEGRFRGVTVSSLMAVSNEPPVIALALTVANSFQELAVPGATLGVSVLDASHDFAAERFAGRAPLPDAQLSGVSHKLVEGIPVLDGALAWCVGRVRHRETVGGHVLIVLEVDHGDIGPDTDDPLLAYEGRYRRLEAS